MSRLKQEIAQKDEELFNKVQEDVKKNAELYGNKAANLLELKKICPGHIPLFCPLSHEFILSHLDKNTPHWRSLWEQFQLAQGENKVDLQPQTLSILKSLRELVITAFENHPIESPELLDFLSHMQHEHASLMVRSTGHEDTATVANPGGNISVAAVSPSKEIVSSAIGKVIASYFSEKSLKQRLLTQDNITQAAFMPLLLQQMVGERQESNQVPRSGVMYTGEGLTRIQVAPGHGELVVDSKAPCDTFHITRAKRVYAEITNKSYRLAPTEQGLDWKKNNKALQTSASISSKTALEIAKIGQDIEKHYGMPMDVEFVYNPTNDHIAIVQARPIPANRVKAITPSTISPSKMPALKESIKNNHVQKIAAQVVTPAGFAAKIITDKNQVLICDTIDEALNIHLKQSDSPVQVVLIREMAPSTSHAAAQFSAQAIPVLQITDSETAKDCLSRPEPVLVIDPQRDQILNFNPTASPDTSNLAIAQSYIEEGMFTYPITPITEQPIFLEITELKSLFEKIKRMPVDKAHIYSQLLKHIEALETITETENSQAENALNSIRYIFYLLARSSQGEMVFFGQAILLCEEIEKSLLHPESWEEHLSLVARLKSFVTHPGNRDTFSNSILQLSPEIKTKKLLQANYPNLNAEQLDYLAQFLKLNQIAFNFQTQQIWTKFVLDNLKDQNTIQKLAEIVKFYVENQLESTFINQELVEIFKQQPTSSNALNTLYKNYQQAKKELIDLQLDEADSVMKGWEQRISQWSDPAKFEELWSDYEKDMQKLNEKFSFNPPIDIVFLKDCTRASYDYMRAVTSTNQVLVVYPNKRIYLTDRSKSPPRRATSEKNYYSVFPDLINYDRQVPRRLRADEYHLIDKKNASWSIFYSDKKLTSEEIFTKIKTDCAYVLIEDTLYFVDKKATSFVESKITDLTKQLSIKSIIKNEFKSGKKDTFIMCYDRSIKVELEQAAQAYEGHYASTTSYSKVTRHVILKKVLMLTELMDKTIKSLKGSPEYLQQQTELLVGRFRQLLQPYYKLMTDWMIALPNVEYEKWYYKVDSYRDANGCRNQMLEHIGARLKPFSNGTNNKNELAPSGAISIASAKLGSGANFERQFINKESEITLEDVFSLIHQNIISAVNAVKEVQAPTDIQSLPIELQPLLTTFQKTSSNNHHSEIKFDLCSVTHHVPILSLQYNLSLANHSAQFNIDYNQSTRKITIHGHVFGGNWSGRLNIMQNAITTDGLLFGLLGVTVNKSPLYSEDTLSLGFEWEFPVKLVEEESFITNLHQSFLSYDSMLNVWDSSSSFSTRSSPAIRYPNFSLVIPPVSIDKVADTMNSQLNSLNNAALFIVHRIVDCNGHEEAQQLLSKLSEATLMKLAKISVKAVDLAMLKMIEKDHFHILLSLPINMKKQYNSTIIQYIEGLNSMPTVEESFENSKSLEVNINFLKKNIGDPKKVANEYEKICSAYMVKLQKDLDDGAEGSFKALTQKKFNIVRAAHQELTNPQRFSLGNIQACLNILTKEDNRAILSKRRDTWLANGLKIIATLGIVLIYRALKGEKVTEGGRIVHSFKSQLEKSSPRTTLGSSSKPTKPQP